MAYQKFETDYAGQPLTVETGHIAEQANGALFIRCRDVVVLVTATANRTPREGIDFFPLTCDYEEKLYSVGRIPGSFPRREGRPSEAGVLASRMIDRPLRPLFPKDFRNDVQIIATVVSADQEQDPTTLAVTGASLALAISDIPHAGPVGCVRVGMLDGQLMLNPTLQQIAESELDLVVAGTAGLDQHGRGGCAPGLRGRDAPGDAHGARRDQAAGAVPARHPQCARRQADHELPAGGHRPRGRRRGARAGRRSHRPGGAQRRQGRPRAPARRAQGRGGRIARRALPREARRHQQGVRVGDQEGGAQRHPPRGSAPRRPSHRRDPADLGPGRRAAAHSWQRHLHPRPDAGAVDRHPRLRPGPAEDRRPWARGVQALHAPLQLPAVLRRRGSLPARPGPSRDRPRRPRRAGGAQRHARRRRLPIRRAHRHRDPLQQRLHVDGVGVRLVPRADGRGCAAHRSGGRHRHGPHHRRGRRPRRHPQRHPGDGGRARRHGLQGRRHPAGHHRPADGHEDQGLCAGSWSSRRSSRRASAASTSSARWPRLWLSRAAR